VNRGEIVVEHAARRFRVYPRETRTLKDLVVARRRMRGADVWALRDVSLRAEPGSAVGLVGRNGSGKTTLLRLISGIIKPTSGTVAVGGRVGSLLELGAGFHPDFTGRENVYLNGSLLGLPRRVVREHLDEIVAFAGIDEFIDLPVRTYSSGMAMRLGFAVAAHLEVDVLLLDEVFAVGDEEFQRKCFGKIFEFKQRGGTIVFVSHDASAVERLCERTVLLRGGHVEFDGSTHDAILRYHRQLAAERDPEERGAGLREWGGGEARIADVELLDADGEPRRQFLAGEPLSLRLTLVAEQALEPPRLVYELRGESGLLLAVNALDTAEVGWERGPGELRVRFDVGRLPLADGRFTLRLGLSDPGGGRLYHQLDDAVSFLVHPGAEEGGLLRLEGTWTREEVRTPA
jgi:ABC-type polysaccharide/polyol phosphate transport system ATPase subunit